MFAGFGLEPLRRSDREEVLNHAPYRVRQQVNVGAGVVAAMAGCARVDAEAFDDHVEIVQGFGGPAFFRQPDAVDKTDGTRGESVLRAAFRDETHVEPVAVVREERGVFTAVFPGYKAGEGPQGVGCPGSIGDVGVGDAGQIGDGFGDRTTRADVGRERFTWSAPAAQSHGGDLDDVVPARRKAGGFEVEDDEVHFCRVFNREQGWIGCAKTEADEPTANERE